MDNLSEKNQNYWKKYKPGEIPSVPQLPPKSLLDEIKGPILDVGTGDGKLAEELAEQGLEIYAADVIESVINENLARKSKVHYKLADITTILPYPGSFFDLVIFKFVLTNIHKDAWENVGNEVARVLKPSGFVWCLEPLVSKSYEQRYQLAEPFVHDQHCAYVFKDKNSAEKINTPKQLQAAITNGQVSRVIKHYTLEELKQVFAKFSLENYKTFDIVSPSGFELNTFEGVFTQKLRVL